MPELNYPLIAGLIFGVIALVMYVGPVYGVWASEKSGEAALKEANFEEQIAVARANARLKAAEVNKQSAVIEAQAVADSIKTIGDSLQKNPSYNQWQYIKMLEKTNNSTIYIPTEASLPIVEAGRKPYRRGR